MYIFLDDGIIYKIVDIFFILINIEFFYVLVFIKVMFKNE